MEEQTTVVKSEAVPSYEVGANALDVSQDVLDRIGKEYAERYFRLRRARERSSWEQDVADAFDAYHLNPPKKPLPYEGAANLRCVLPRIGADSFHANVMYTIFGNGFSAKVQPDYTSKDYIVEADKGADFLKVVLEHECGLYAAVDNADWKAETYGVGYLEPRYVRQVAFDIERYKDERIVPEIDPVSGEVTERKTSRWKTRKVKRTLFDGVKIDSLPVRSVTVSPFVRDLKQAVEHDAVFKDYRAQLKTLRMQAKDYDDQPAYYIKGQVEKVSLWATAKVVSGDDSLLEQAKQDFDGFSLHDKVCAEALDLVEVYAWEDVDGDGTPENVCFSLHPESGTVMRVSLTPCRITEIRPRPVDERFYGEGIYKAGLPLFEEWEAVHNWRVNAGQWENMPMGVYEAGGRFNPEEITFTPGHFYPVDRAGGVQFLQTPGVRPSYYQEENLLLMYFERIFGLNENMQGVVSSKDTSATENIQVTQRSGIRFSNPMNRIMQAINEVVGNVWDLYGKCAPADKEYYLTGIGKAGRVLKMTKGDYKNQLKFKLEVSSIFDVQLMRDTWMLAFKMFRADPMVGAHPAAVYELFKNTMKGMGINLDIPKPPQADVLSPSLEHELMAKGQEVEPEIGEDYEEHLRQHLAFTQTEEYEEWSDEDKQALLVHIDKTQILKKTIEQNNLNRSGVYEGGMAPEGPSVTATRNPSQLFNNMRVGESGPSAGANVRNGARPQ